VQADETARRHGNLDVVALDADREFSAQGVDFFRPQLREMFRDRLQPGAIAHRTAVPHLPEIGDRFAKTRAQRLADCGQVVELSTRGLADVAGDRREVVAQIVAAPAAIARAGP